MTHVPPRRRSGIRALLPALAVVALLGAACESPTNAPDPTRALVFRGLGAWWDVYDWSPTVANGSPALGVGDVDRLARAGVQTLYIQASTYRRPDLVLDPARFAAIITRARVLGIRTVAWYLPQFLDMKVDLDRMAAMARSGVDGIAIDIESTDNPDVADRTAKLLAETRFLRGAMPWLPIGAIPVTPVIWESLNRAWWPGFPYRELSNYVDAWLPMAYWSYRTPESGWRDPYRYTLASITWLRTLTGRPQLVVHPVGGEAANLSTADIDAMSRALLDGWAIGGSIYDDRTTAPSLWGSLAQFRRPIVK